MATSSDGLQVHNKQRGSVLLSHIKSLKYTFADIPADFIIGQSACALVLSLKHHNQNPNYIYDRMQEVGKKYRLSVLIVIVDIADPNANLILLAWVSGKEANALEKISSKEISKVCTKYLRKFLKKFEISLTKNCQFMGT